VASWELAAVTSTLASTLMRNLRAERSRAALSQAELAARLGWSEKTMMRIETGERRLFFDEMPDVCRALGISLNRLLLDADPDDMDALYPPGRGR
jgi:transcriptional regulator with XRE-family HTH domain